MASPSWLVVTSLNDERGMLDSYYERLSKTVPTPETMFVPIENGDWETGQVLSFMERHGFTEAFVRTNKKASPKRLVEGSFITDRTAESVNSTIESLLAHVNNSAWEHGGKLAIRELLDTSFCMKTEHIMCHPEIRYFIEGGDILSRTGNMSVSCRYSYEYLEPVISNASPPDTLAKDVAEEFCELPFAVDFLLDTNGDWYCVEMGVNGVRWEPESKQWVNICGQGTKEAYSPAVIHSPALRGISP